MVRKILLPLFALFGLLFAFYTVSRGSAPTPISPPVAEPAQAPYKTYVAGAGIIEASTENIAIGTPVAGIVSEIYVKVGSQVKTNDPLFKIEDRELQAELEVRKASVKSAQARLEKLKLSPRPEDIPPVEARVQETKSLLEDLRSQLKRWESVEDKRAINADLLSQKQFAVLSAEAKLKQSEAELSLLKAGTWKPDLDIAQAELNAAEALVRATQIEQERRIIRAPVDGELLQVKIRLGEFAQTGVLSTPLMLLGNTAKLHVRVDVDENDAWRIRSQAPAVAFVRGNKELKTDLHFVRIEPYVVPKRSLTGDSTERVDTRVLQLLFSFDRNSLPVYVGQQMDVFIEAPTGEKTGENK